MTLKMIATDCQGGQCPTLYQTDRGTFVVRGYRLLDEAERANMNLPDNEDAVEVTPSLVEAMANALSR